MSIAGCESSPADRNAITSLLCAALAIEENAVAIAPAFQRWKYWEPHPLLSGGRSHILKKEGAIVAHGGVWPIQLYTSAARSNAFHLIDWAAAREVPGAGMQVLRQCCSGMAAVFSIGGSAMTRKILPVFGFKPYNPMSLMHRPLRPIRSALRESRLDWKTPARVLRNLYRHLYPAHAVPERWRVTSVEPEQIPGDLWPAPSSGVAVSGRSSELLSHVGRCPAIRRSACAIVGDHAGSAAAYFLLVEVGNQVRLADYGPARLDEETCRVIGLGAQEVAHSLFPNATSIMAATSEPSARTGFLRAGFRLGREEPIKVLKLDQSLSSINEFRLTLLDWDALCL